VSPDKQPWERSLSFARSAFEHESLTASFTLFQALADAHRMANHCHDKLLETGRKPLPVSTSADWERFLRTLYNDAWKVYLKYKGQVRLRNQQVTFEDLRDTAKVALLKLQDMNAGRPTSRARGDVLKALSHLVTVLEDAKEELGEQQGIREIDDIPTGFASHEAAYVPLVGQIAAGEPILAEEFIEDTFPLPKQLVGEGRLFLLKVVGDSMINAAIADGDWVVVRQQRVAENGEIVAALIEGEATVKTFKLSDDNHVWLIPHNPAYNPISGDKATLLGKVVAVLRRV
jgi:SOS regulatory protein LexA